MGVTTSGYGHPDLVLSHLVGLFTLHFVVVLVVRVVTVVVVVAVVVLVSQRCVSQKPRIDTQSCFCQLGLLFLSLAPCLLRR